MTKSMPAEQRAQLAASASINPQGEFEIIAITEGTGNGWNFSAQVLKESLGLWNGVNSYVDHAGLFEMPSVMKLGGVCYSRPHLGRSRQRREAQAAAHRPAGPHRG